MRGVQSIGVEKERKRGRGWSGKRRRAAGVNVYRGENGRRGFVHAFWRMRS